MKRGKKKVLFLAFSSEAQPIGAMDQQLFAFVLACPLRLFPPSDALTVAKLHQSGLLLFFETL